MSNQMNMSEARAAVQPFINSKNAAEYMAETDKGFWVETNIMHPAGINSSICTDFGETLCNYIEDQLSGGDV